MRPPADEEEGYHFQPREEAVAPIAKKYFDWHGTVQGVSSQLKILLRILTVPRTFHI
jgi:hypothetical protein